MAFQGRAFSVMTWSDISGRPFLCDLRPAYVCETQNLVGVADFRRPPAQLCYNSGMSDEQRTTRPETLPLHVR